MPTESRNFDDGRYATMAQYSTPIKAQKAMDLLHRTYTGMLSLKNCEISHDTMEQLEEMSRHGFGVLSIKDQEQNVTFEPMNFCFRFPSDDEIE